MPAPTGPTRRTGRLDVLAAVVTAVFTGTLRRYQIAEDSMRPALGDGDWVLARAKPPRLSKGDVVVFDLPGREGFEVVKRIDRVEPDGSLFLLGDNPDAGSVDSNAFGSISPDAVSARLLLRYRPLPLRRVR